MRERLSDMSERDEDQREGGPRPAEPARATQRDLVILSLLRCPESPSEPLGHDVLRT